MLELFEKDLDRKLKRNKYQKFNIRGLIEKRCEGLSENEISVFTSEVHALLYSYKNQELILFDKMEVAFLRLKPNNDRQKGAINVRADIKFSEYYKKKYPQTTSQKITSALIVKIVVIVIIFILSVIAAKVGLPEKAKSYIQSIFPKESPQQKVSDSTTIPKKPTAPE